MGFLLIWRNAMTLKTHESITVRLSPTRVPVSFRWRGFCIHIDFIDRIWRKSHRNPRDQRLYRVRSRGFTFVLHHDRLVDRWTVVRSPLRFRCGLMLSEFAERFVHSRRTAGAPV